MYTSKITVISQFIFLIVVFLLPTFFLPLNLISIEPLKIALSLLVAVLLSTVVLVRKIKKNSFFVTKNLLWISIGSVLLSSLFSTIFSNNINISLFGRQINFASFGSLMLLFALSYAVSVFFDDTKSKSKLFLTVHSALIITVFMHVVSILMPFIPNFGFFVNNTINTVGKWYDLGLFALFGMISSALVLQYLKRSKFYQIIGWVGMVLSLILVILINSLLVWIMAACFALLYVVLNAMGQHSDRPHNQISYPALGILIISIIFILIGGKTGTLINSVFGFQFEEVRPTLSSTIEVTGDTLRENPFFGVGLNRFESAWLKYRPIGVNNSDYWDTDFRYGYSNILSIPVTQGILGIIAWLFFIVISVYFIFKLLLSSLEQKPDQFIHLYSAFGYLFFLVVMIVYVPSPVMIAFFFIFLGLFVSNLNNTGLIIYKKVLLDKSPRISFGYILTLVVLLVAIVYGGFTVLSQYSSRLLFDNATREYTKTGNLQAAEKNILNAQFVYGSDVYIKSLAEIGLLKINLIFQNTSLTQEQAIEQFRSTLDTTVGYAKAAIAYDEQSYSNKLSLVSIYKTLVPLKIPGAKEEALKEIDKIESLTPNNPSLNLERARIYSASGDYDNATTEITKAIELKPNFVDAVFLLSQIQVEKGEIDQAILSIQAALGVQRLNPSLHFQLGLLKYNQQKFGESISSFENAVTLSPYFGNAKYFLGLSYYQNKDTTSAITQFENLAQMYPSNAEVNLVLGNLKTGKTPFDGVQPPLDANPENRDTLPVEDDQSDSTDPEDASDSENLSTE